MTDNTLTLLYYSFACSHLIYGITAWGTNNQHKLHKIEVKLNNIVRTITKNKKFSHVTFLYKKLNFLELKDVYKLELVKFMQNLFHIKIPNVFKTNFIKLINVHTHEIRRPNQSNYFLLCVNKIACQHKLNYRGVKLWNEIRDELKNNSFNQCHNNNFAIEVCIDDANCFVANSWISLENLQWCYKTGEVFDLPPKTTLKCLCHLLNLSLPHPAAQIGKYLKTASCLLLFDSLASLDVMTINKTVSFDLIFLLIWQNVVSILKLLRL